ncbi:hypothetical protein NPJ88_005115, partial [Halomonas elongata]|uniref:hypothetical protein n=1 Tax=Halomonas elongata TaxID=2746 RepID=UPI00255B1D13
METFLKDRQGFCCIGNVYFRYNLAFKGAPLVITFSFLGANATKEEAQKGSFVPWAYNFIVSQELNAISFCCIGKDNWYTDSEFQDKAAQLGEEIKATGLEVL